VTNPGDRDWTVVRFTRIVMTASDTTGKTISSDVFCYQCGYNLRGLSSSHKCPECGNEIAESLGRWTVWPKLPLRLAAAFALLGIALTIAPLLLFRPPRPDVYEFGGPVLGFVSELVALRCAVESHLRRSSASPKQRRLTKITLFATGLLVLLLGFASFAMLSFFLG